MCGGGGGAGRASNAQKIMNATRGVRPPNRNCRVPFGSDDAPFNAKFVSFLVVAAELSEKANGKKGSREKRVGDGERESNCLENISIMSMSYSYIYSFSF